MADFKPLPDFVDIGLSKIHGKGLIATEYIVAGTDLGISHIEDDSGRFHDNMIRTALGAFINHSTNPNCTLVAQGKYHYLITSVDIPRKTELTVDYRLYTCGRNQSCAQ